MNDSLTALALLGTSRKTELPPAPHELLESSWNSLAEQNLSPAVLQAAALEATLHRAGQLPLTNVPLPTPAKEDTHPPLSAASVQAAERMLKGEFAQGLSEWFELAAASHRVAPARILPRLLEHGTRHPHSREALRMIGGSRGAWLAQRDDRWSWLLEEQSVSDDVWEEGTPVERLAWLQQVRTTNPGRAADAIATEWRSESPDQREKFAALVADSPHPGDADWLEQLALKDRRQGTRRSAVRGLMRLPKSAFYQRALTRASALLTLQSNLLTLDPPDHYEPAWGEDGIREKPTGKIGKRAWWSRQILAQIPLSVWTDHFRLSPDQLFTVSLDSDWSSTILEAWIDSALAYPEAALLASFLPFLTRHASFTELRHPSSVLFDLLRPFSRSECADLLDSLVLDPVDRLQLLVRLQPLANPKKHPQLTAALRDWWDDPHLAVTRPEATALAFCPDPKTIPGLLQTIGKKESLSSATETFARALEFRQSYL